ncbi:hypothetical protein [Desulfosarcina ovata]|uniref:HepT-like domain-containing protein n=1 Tax=Desulfosarcina ovata subsp. ovata TaxID=2752305 RepID=A0A5K8A7Z6_9BACT|nr:hypothetical protein [Desulfosarcina ovata]BBO88586.1 hypothetical protein DSCOOX_17660 [Desulfosarcina ovata subsp. ovata]
MEETKIALFLADFDHQVAQINNIYERLEIKSKALSKNKVASETVESAGYWLHNLYCAYEDLFKIVSSFWENNIRDDGSFHQSLIRRMLLNIEGVRPSLLSEKAFTHLDELRSFRHVFRHAYSYGLDDERVIHLINRILNNKNIPLVEIQRFKEKVTTLIALREDSP